MNGKELGNKVREEMKKENKRVKIGEKPISKKNLAAKGVNLGFFRGSTDYHTIKI